MDRKVSKHMVVVFNPMNDPSIPEQLKAEQAKNPKVTGLMTPYNRLGLVETPKGTFCIDTEGVGDSNPIDATGVEFLFFRMFADGWEAAHFAKATYSLADCKACATGDVVPLHEFVETGKARKEENYQQWDKFFDEQVTT